MGEEGFTASRRPDQENIRFVEFNAVGDGIGVVLFHQTQALVMVIDSHGKDFFRFVLTDDMFIEIMLNFPGFGDIFKINLFGGSLRGIFFRRSPYAHARCIFHELLIEDFITQLDTFITNIDPRPGD